MNETAINRDDAEELVEKVKADQSKALHAPKSLDDYPDVDGARTAARYLGGGEFEVVTTKVKNFPKGKDNVGTHSWTSVVNWATAQNPDVIDVVDEEGFSDE